MADVEHDHHMPDVIDFMQHPPAAAQTGAVDAGQLRAERLAGAAGARSIAAVSNTAR